MSYKAFLNNSIFFTTEADLKDLKILKGIINLEAGQAGTFDFSIPACNIAYGQFH